MSAPESSTPGCCNEGDAQPSNASSAGSEHMATSSVGASELLAAPPCGHATAPLGAMEAPAAPASSSSPSAATACAAAAAADVAAVGSATTSLLALSVSDATLGSARGFRLLTPQSSSSTPLRFAFAVAFCFPLSSSSLSSISTTECPHPPRRSTRGFASFRRGVPSAATTASDWPCATWPSACCAEGALPPATRRAASLRPWGGGGGCSSRTNRCASPS
mmetsp:Transcript_89724/g.228230  ORF Transcript_89724/g.228230 Transcript_89724/m.228230 type:complete len:220 (-) Transcript_89724:283-942(-)